jgi:hypothetical protein
MFHGRLSDRCVDLDAEFRAMGAEDQARRTSERMDEVDVDIERLLMLTEALWSMIKEEHGYEDEALVQRVLEIDARDGRIDGKLAVDRPADCPHCQRPLVKNRRYCLYCGEPTPVELFQR